MLRKVIFFFIIALIFGSILSPGIQIGCASYISDGLFEQDKPESARGNDGTAHTRSNQPIPINGDWYINASITYHNTSYLIQGNLTVNTGVVLTLINMSIIFDSDENNTYGLFIEPGGTLKTTDWDGDFATESDNTVIRANASTFTFHAKPGSRLSMENTHVQFGGSKQSDNTSGILVEGDHSSLRSCSINNSSRGLIINNTYDTFLDNIVFDNIQETNILILNSTDVYLYNLNLTGSNNAVQIEDSQYVYLNDTEFYTNNIALNLINTDEVYLNDVNLSLNTISIKSNSSLMELRNCRMYDNTIGAVFQNSSIGIYKNFSLYNTNIYMNNLTSMQIWDLRPIPGPASEFWDGILYDNTSLFQLNNQVKFVLEAPEDLPFPEEGMINIYNPGTQNYSTYQTRGIDPGPFEVTLTPVAIMAGVMYWVDSFVIDFNSNGYFLNETFSVLTSDNFTFRLSYNTAPELRNSRVVPTKGDTNTHFIFYVEYYDADGDEPSSVGLILGDRSYPMERLPDSNDPLVGIKYQMEFTNLAEGTYEFKFEADDGRGFPNSIKVIQPSSVIEVEAGKKSKDESDDNTNAFIFITICFVMVFIFFIFMIVLSYIMRKKMAQVGGMQPGTLPEDMEELRKQETIVCSECGAEIDADVSSCPKCGEVFEGEEYQCPKCGKIIPEEADKCPHCGNVFLALEDLSAIEDKKVTVIEDKFYCSECGAVVAESMTECPGCGELFEPEIEDYDKADTEKEGKSPRGSGKVSKTRRKKESEEDESFICSVCGASVRPSANKCPKCKTEFE